MLQSPNVLWKLNHAALQLLSSGFVFYETNQTIILHQVKLNRNLLYSASVLWRLNHAALCMFGLFSSFLTSSGINEISCFMKLSYLNKCNWIKETVERSHGETLYVLKPKQLALKKTVFNPKKFLPNFFFNFLNFFIKQLFSADAAM